VSLALTQYLVQTSLDSHESFNPKMKFQRKVSHCHFVVAQTDSRRVRWIGKSKPPRIQTSPSRAGLKKSLDLKTDLRNIRILNGGSFMPRAASFGIAALALVLLGSTVSATETITHTYDARGRLIKIVRTGTVNNNNQVCYKLDKAGNRTNVKSTVNSLPTCP
jgi:hypothetical protein